MGDWQHPEHYSADARSYHEAERGTCIALFVDRCIPPIREAVRDLGWTIAVHGSQRRDLDLIAVPWTDEAADADAVAAAVAEATKQATGWGHLANSGYRETKPHGRFAVTILATAEIHLDLSVMPRVPC